MSYWGNMLFQHQNVIKTVYHRDMYCTLIDKLGTTLQAMYEYHREQHEDDLYSFKQCEIFLYSLLQSITSYIYIPTLH